MTKRKLVVCCVRPKETVSASFLPLWCQEPVSASCHPIRTQTLRFDPAATGGEIASCDLCVDGAGKRQSLPLSGKSRNPALSAHSAKSRNPYLAKRQSLPFGPKPLAFRRFPCQEFPRSLENSFLVVGRATCDWCEGWKNAKFAFLLTAIQT